MKNSLQELHIYGQSIWLDYIRRDLIEGGGLRRMIEEDGISGMTSNPSLFEEAITTSPDYDEAITKLTRRGKNPAEIFDQLTQKDVGEAADTFRELFESSGHDQGYVSLEVNPKLAYDTEGTITEARRLWNALKRPNVMIKVPATKNGLAAIKQLTSEGININITLLFSIERYRSVAEAYIEGLEMRRKEGHEIKNIFSVASFFLSRIDVLIDPMIEKISDVQIRNALHGELAIASARIAYKNFKEMFYGPRFEKLHAEGGRRQSVLWASTSTKNPEYSDIKYVEPLIGPDTINTLPQKTIEAYRDHGIPQNRIEDGIPEAEKKFELLKKAGIDINAATDQLEREGVDKFTKAYEKALEALKKKASASHDGASLKQKSTVER